MDMQILIDGLSLLIPRVNKEDPKWKRALKYFVRIFVILIIVLIIVASLLLAFEKLQDVYRGSTPITSENNIIEESELDETDILTSKKEAIVTAYPEFKNFETSDSFAGVSVKTVEKGNDHYFAYITHGSGLPIAEATCFRVDRMMRVYNVGEFPDYLDSYAGYRDVNPVDCSGVK